ncbi:hypothetical protein G9A89_021534 [Geosiphon pyriformis]|nr:hypothetical protein G9A89_021534 [Geosiphon pyriformis]
MNNTQVEDVRNRVEQTILEKEISTNYLLVYTDESLSNLGSVGCRAGAAGFFEDIDLGLGVGVSDLMLSTLVELQAIVLALKYVPSLYSVNLFSDSQSALDACKSELGLTYSDFRNQCWIEHHYIINVICSKNLKVNWHKVKGHSGVSRNECVDTIASDASFSDWYFPFHLGEHFIMTNGVVVSGNSRHFVHNIYYSICHTCWKVGFGSRILVSGLLSEVDWHCLSLVWHPDLHMAAGFTSRLSANTCTYFMKALHHQLPVAVRKCLYNRLYPSVLCLYCGDVEASDHVFFYKIDNSMVSGFSYSSSGILQLLSLCVSDSSLSIALFKNFVFNDWFHETVTVFHDFKIAGLEIVKFVYFFSLALRSNVWSVCAKHCAYIEKNRLISLDGSVLVSISGLASEFLAGVVKLLGIADAFGVYFGFHKSCLFFSDVSDSVLVHIAV